jgi:hypothetical protein
VLFRLLCGTEYHNISRRSWSQPVVLVRAPVIQDGSLWVVLVDTISETGNLSTSRSLPHLLDLFLLSELVFSYCVTQSQKIRDPNKNKLHFVFDDKVVMSTLYFIQNA